MITIMRHSLLDTLLHAKMVSVNAWINADTMFLPVKEKLQPAQHGTTICRPMTNNEINITIAQLNQLGIKHNL